MKIRIVHNYNETGFPDVNKICVVTAPDDLSLPKITKLLKNAWADFQKSEPDTDSYFGEYVEASLVGFKAVTEDIEEIEV